MGNRETGVAIKLKRLQLPFYAAEAFFLISFLNPPDKSNGNTLSTFPE
jgi:hypothetical protein